jgi:polysaccharide export outer membrane protein
MLASSSNEELRGMTLGQEPEYLLGPGDVLEVIYQLRNLERAETYKLEVNDTVELTFLYTPQFNRRLFVRSDGKIGFPLIGDVRVSQRSTAEVLDELNEKYRQILKDPRLDLTVVESNRAIEELKRAITTAPRGQSRLEPIRPDGYLSLPLIGDVRGAGRTVPQLSADIVKLYRDNRVQDIDVTVVLLEVKANKMYIYGEVNNPGVVVPQGPIDLWRGVGLAGGFAPGADLSQVVLTRNVDGRELRRTFDFHAWKSGASDQNLLLRRGDIVTVTPAPSRFIYLAGEIEKPGPIEMKSTDTLYASQALALGGRLLSSGDRTEVLVLRRDAQGNPVIKKVNVLGYWEQDEYEEGDAPMEDPQVFPGDIVYVPSSSIGDVNRFAEAYFKNGIWTILPFNFVATYRVND